MYRILFPALVACSVFSCTQKQVSVDYDKLDAAAKRLPENAIYGMELPEGLEISLFASEPMIINPTNLHVDERGRVWVCEALNYRNTHNPENPYRSEGDRIVILEDTDSDGKADVSKVFYQGTDVNAALGIWAVGNRAIVSCSPHVFVLTDTDGDDKADRKDTLFSGLGGLQTDHAVHAFVLGPDGKLYFNFGNTGAHIFDAKGNPVLEQSGRPVNDEGKPYRQGMVFRCNPDGSELEVLGHNFRNNFEAAPDAFGALWQSDNDDDGNKGVRINYVMDYGNFGYTDEISGAGWQERRLGWENDIPSRHWHQNDPGVVPNLLQTGSGSPCGIMIYEGNLLPKPFQNAMIHAEAGHNVVRAYPVMPEGAGYKSEIVNLVKGKDEWFRPSDVCAAPDGSVFIADWYDPAVGGHKFGDVERGRIYRVAPKGKVYKPKPFPIDNPEAAAGALGNANLSIRTQAWEKLSRWGEQSVPELEKLWNGPDARQRARALWILGKMPDKSNRYIAAALQDADVDIRCAGMRLARQVYHAGRRPDLPCDSVQLLRFIKNVVRDPAAAVRREAALSLRYLRSAESAAVWAELAAQHDGKDRWYLEALGIGSDLNADSCFAVWYKQNPAAESTAAGRDLVWRSRSAAALPLLAKLISDPQTTPENARRWFRAFDFHPGPEKNVVISSLLNLEHPLRDSLNRYALFQLDPDYARSSPQTRSLMDKILPSLQGTEDYLYIVRKHKPAGQQGVLLDMALNNPERKLQVQAARLLVENGGLPALLGRFSAADEATRIKLLGICGSIQRPELFNLYTRYLNDPKAGPGLQRAAIAALGSSWDGEIELMKLVETGKIPSGVRTAALVHLSGVWNTEVRQKARALLAQTGQQSTQLPPVAVLENKVGNPAAGRIVFSQHCALCHVAGSEGQNFGPALSEIGDKLAKSALYTSILYPSSGINFGYEGYRVKLKNGSETAGIIESKTAAAVTLRMAGGITQTFNTADIATLQEMGESLMTEGLARSMSERELVDLVEYLAALKGTQ